MLGELSAYWNVHLQFILMGVVMLVSSVCLLVKVGLSVYVRMVEREQNRFLKWNYCKQYEDSESVVSGMIQASIKLFATITISPESECTPFIVENTAAILPRRRRNICGMSKFEVSWYNKHNNCRYRSSVCEFSIYLASHLEIHCTAIAHLHSCRYSVTVSKSALTNAKTPIQRKRLLSVAAAIEDDEERAVEGLMRERRGWKEEEEEKEDNKEEDGGGFSCDEKAAGGGDLPMKRLDSETGQTIVGTDTKESGMDYLDTEMTKDSLS